MLRHGRYIRKDGVRGFHFDEEINMAFEFEFIADQRFKGTKNKLKLMDKRLKITLDGLKCTKLKDATGIRELNFTGDEPGKQWRKKYVVSKHCSPPTWDEVMGKINKIQAPVYKRI